MSQSPLIANEQPSSELKFLRDDLARYRLHGELKWYEPSLWALCDYRFRRWGDSLRWRPLRKLLRLASMFPHAVLRLVTGIDLPRSARIGPGLRIWHFGGVVVHPEAVIGRNCTLRHEVTIGSRHGEHDVPVLGDDVEIGAGAKVLGKIHIGDRVRIGANAVVLDDVPDDHVAVGVPARILPSARPRAHRPGHRVGHRVIDMPRNGKKHIAFFLPNLLVGGAERATVYLANGLAQRGHQVDMVLMKAEGPNLQCVAKTVRIVDLNARRAMASILPLARYLRREKPDVLLPALEHANVAAFLGRALARVSLPLVANVHTTLSRALAHGARWRDRALVRAVRWCYPRMDAICTVSRGAAEDLVRMAGAQPQRVRVIYPILTEGIRQIAEGPAGHPWFAAGQPGVVLGVGRLCPQKDFATLIRAFALVRRRHAVRLVVFGNGGLRGELERLVKELDLTEAAVLPGYVENIFSCMAKAALFTLSSAWEAMPMVLTEALACGCPVVAADCRSGPDEILQGGRYGRLVPAGDVEAMAEAMCRTLAEPRIEFPADALRPFSAEFVLDQYAQMIDEVTHA